MEHSLAVKGIANSKVLRDVKELISRIAGIDFSFVDLKERPVILAKCADAFCSKMLSSKRDRLFFELLENGCKQIVETKKPFLYDYRGVTLALLPVIIAEEAVAAILVCPQKKSPEATHYKKIVKDAAALLFIVINYIFKNELDLLIISRSDKQYSRNQEAVIKAVAYIKRNYHDKDISLQKVASIAALSHYYFSHIFKDELNITFIEYLTKVRMDAAAKLLKNKKLNVNQIAYAVGYQDPNYFSKVFKRYMKTSPIDYRQMLFKKGGEKQIITI